MTNEELTLGVFGTMLEKLRVETGKSRTEMAAILGWSRQKYHMTITRGPAFYDIRDVGERFNLNKSLLLFMSYMDRFDDDLRRLEESRFTEHTPQVKQGRKKDKEESKNYEF